MKRVSSSDSERTDRPAGYTHVTAPTLFLKANGINFAYRRFGNVGGIPLVFYPHILGNLDSWDPAVTDGLARGRDVILFDNAGIGKSTGDVPNIFSDMARDSLVFIDALGLSLKLLPYLIAV
jgi:pimeloyl-ACP methyl ester carboxylesterase